MKKKDRIEFEKLSEELNLLTEKKRSTKLSDVEEERYTDLQHKIDVLLNGKHAFPRKVFTKEFGNKLDDVLAKTDEFLKRIGYKEEKK